ncbi:hypothetical protein ECANGB1_241 [Enterospora canceri]|uniref:Uncharacterized protein n=1 Tax=Enterospora canceri TaxID=1081671 RepID=A0A1Y1S8B7_9MICR|nr:hypothetical protein ECANGB1_241 [Enterospora canceri]
MHGILKEVLQKIKNVAFEKEKVRIGAKQYEYSIEVEFKTVQKKYTLGAVLFYITDLNLKHIDYITKCSEKQVKPIGLQDKAKVLEEIRMFKNAKTPGHFERVTYSLNRQYQIPVIAEENYILIGNDPLGELNFANLQLFLTEGRITAEKQSSLLSQSTSFEKEGIKFKIFNDFSKFTKKQWAMVRVVCVDGLLTDLKRNCPDFSALREAALFIGMDKKDLKKCKESGVDPMEPVIKDGFVFNHGVIWDRIQKVVD